jgi:hypothetical protein
LSNWDFVRSVLNLFISVSSLIFGNVEGEREEGEGRREKGEGRREKGEGRREKGEGRRLEGGRDVLGFYPLHHHLELLRLLLLYPFPIHQLYLFSIDFIIAPS